MTCAEFGDQLTRMKSGADPTGTELRALVAHMDRCPVCRSRCERSHARWEAAGKPHLGVFDRDWGGRIARRDGDPEA